MNESKIKFVIPINWEQLGKGQAKQNQADKSYDIDILLPDLIAKDSGIKRIWNRVLYFFFKRTSDIDGGKLFLYAFFAVFFFMPLMIILFK